MGWPQKWHTPLLAFSMLSLVSLGVSAKTKLVFWDAWSGADQKVLDALVKEYSEKSGVDVQVLSVAGQGNLLEKALLAIVGGTGPDVLVAHSVSFGAFINSGLCSDLKPLMKAAGIEESAFQKGFLKLTSNKGKVYGIPFSTYWNLIGYNKQILAESGVASGSIPADIDEFDELAAKLSRIKPGGAIDRLGFQPWGLDWYVFPYSFGGSYFDDDKNQVTAESKGMLRYMKWCQSYGTRYGWQKLQSFGNLAGSMMGTTADSAFYKNKVAMQIAGLWFVEYSKKLSPKGSYGYAPFPYPKDGVPNAYLPQGSALVIPKSSKKQKEAMNFIKYLISDGFSEKWFDGIGNLPATVSGFKKLAAKYQNTGYSPFFKALDGTPFFLPTIPNTLNYLTALDDARWAVLGGKQSPETALKAVQSDIQKEYNRQIRKR